MLGEEALREEKFGIEVLLLRPVVGDGDAPRRSLPALQPPLALEHARDRRVEITGLRPAQSGAASSSPAGVLGAGEQRVQERAAGVGVDLDEPRAVVGQVEVVAHEGATRPEVEPRDLGSASRTASLVGGQAGRDSIARTARKHGVGATLT